MLPCEHPIKGLLKSLASLRFWPERFVIIDNAIGISPGLPGVPNNLTSNFSVWINPHVNRPHHHARRQIIFDFFVFLLTKVVRYLQRHDSPVAIVTKDRVIRNAELAPDYLACLDYPLPGEVQRLRIGKIKRSKEVDNEIVTESILRERRAIAVCDLPTRSRNIENVGARQLLRLERRNNRLFFRRSAWTRRRRRH